MCGRYVLATNYADLEALFGQASFPQELGANYNVAPSQEILTVSVADGKRAASFRRWGLVPSWAKDVGIGNKLINARSETAGEKPSFRAAMKKRRCLVPMSGFFEWKREGSKKQPYFIHTQEPLFATAGLWERWERPDQTVLSCTLLTTSANDAIAAIHDRMPVIVPQEHFALWLDPEVTKPDELAPLLVPYPSDGIAMHPVSPRVNSPRESGGDLILPA